MIERIKDIGEFGLIRRIQEVLEMEGVPPPQGTLGIGDDSASFRPRNGFEILVTCDSLVEGRHFLLPWITFIELGRRAMVQNISDIGAMGGHPLFALISLGLKEDQAVKDIADLYRGFLLELRPFQASIIGGNLTRCGAEMFIDITLIGEVEEGKSLRRSGAAAGDLILVSGFPGQAAAGLQLLLHHPDDPRVREHPLAKAYLRPSHQARLGEAVAHSGWASAMIDVSDGFLGDLGHICTESGVGARLFPEKFPFSEAILAVAEGLGKKALDFFLGSSDDYELIMTCRPERAEALQAVAASLDPPARLTVVGEITARQGEITLVEEDGSERPLSPTGWDHFRLRP